MFTEFAIDARRHGPGRLLYAWDFQGNNVASSGSTHSVHIFNRQGCLIDQIDLLSQTRCTHLAWSENGEYLAIAQANSSKLILWNIHARKTIESIKLYCRDISLMQWSKVPGSGYLALGTNRGHLYIYNNKSRDQILAGCKHKRRISCGDWNLKNQFAFGSEGRQITVCDYLGQIVDQVKIKSPPQTIIYGGKRNSNKLILSVNMGSKTILLYDALQRENALELAFQDRYGQIVGYQWFGDGYILAGFSQGYVVVISTHTNEIGHEQYCAKFHRTSLREIAFNEKNGTIATLGDNCMKVVRMKDWKEIAMMEFIHTTGNPDNSSTSDPPFINSNPATKKLFSLKYDSQEASVKSSHNYNRSAKSKHLISNENTIMIEDMNWTPDGAILSVVNNSAGKLLHYSIQDASVSFPLFGLDDMFDVFVKPIPVKGFCLIVVIVLLGGLLLLSMILDAPIMDILQAMTGNMQMI